MGATRRRLATSFAGGMIVLGATGLGFVLGVTRSAPNEARAENAVPVVDCGDVNWDGAINLTDATYLLNYLFLSGPQPTCAPPYRLPATGQTRCWDALNEENEECDLLPGQDGFYQAGCAMTVRFIDHGDGTVTDRCTGLMWQKEVVDVNRDGVGDTNDRATWVNAITYSENLLFSTNGRWLRNPDELQDGEEVCYDDWRLPNVHELSSLHDYSRSPPVNEEFFPVAEGQRWHWTSTTHPASRNWAIVVCMGPYRDPYYTHSYSTKNRDTLHVFRAVRGPVAVAE